MISTAEEFLKQAHLYRLGTLPTEEANPKTAALSDWAKNDIDFGLRRVSEVDQGALRVLGSRFQSLRTLYDSIRATFESGGRVYLCGCGATGRLSLALESFWRRSFPSGEWNDRVVGLMAGGDVALVKSVETFEDHPDFGERHLLELGFKDGDLLIATTEGGETPYVIGATEAAARVSKRKPWFLFCNPPALLARTAERSRRVIEDARVEKAAFEIGPMALSGSTRLQASTVLMLAVGLCLLEPTTDFDYAASRLTDFIDTHAKIDYGFLSTPIMEESRLYASGRRVLYQTRDYGMTVLTDTTERSPTFSLAPFENDQDVSAPPSWSHLHIPGAPDAAAAWREVLGRDPRGLEWNGFEDRLNLNRILGFDFSDRASARRPWPTFQIDRVSKGIRLRMGNFGHTVEVSRSIARVQEGLDLLFEETHLKLILNMHSLFVMGRMGRYEGNLMTYVRPSNGKLVDRAIRYVRELAALRRVPVPSYEQTARLLFKAWEGAHEDEPLVLKTLELLQ